MSPSLIFKNGDNMKPVILFRKSLAEEGEFICAKQYFDVYENRAVIPAGSEVICRYSALPFYKELEQDLSVNSCCLVNTFEEHSWIADFDYYQDMKEYTFESWNEDEFPYCDYSGPFVVKGATNSKKFQWGKLMYAHDKRRALEVGCDLLEDGLVSGQKLIYRKYEKLKQFTTENYGLPICDEWRFFFYKNTLLSYGFYWSGFEEIYKPKIETGMIHFAETLANIASQNVNFFVLDIAKKEDGSYVLVEINDGQMSGLSENNPVTLYANLSKCFMEE